MIIVLLNIRYYGSFSANERSVVVYFLESLYYQFIHENFRCDQTKSGFELSKEIKTIFTADELDTKCRDEIFGK